MLALRSLRQACVGYLAAARSWVLFFNIGDGVSFPVLLLKIGIIFVAEVTAGYILASFCGLFLDFLNVKTRGLTRTCEPSYAQALGAWLFALGPLGGALILLGIFLIWGISLLF